MRFDDRLNTVLAQPVTNAHDRAVRWRQLVELLARAPELSSPLAQQALEAVRSEAAEVDEQLRAAAARAVARPQLPADLVAAFAADAISVSAPVLAAASLSAEQWAQALETASLESRRFIRALHPDLPERDSAARPKSPEPAAEAPAEPGPPSGVPSISEVLARIERFRQDREAEVPHRASAARARAPRMPRVTAPLFRWECGPSGEIAWVEGVPRGALIGRSLANPGEHNGVDERIQRAFALRAPFRDASLTVSGEGAAAGEWRLSGVPAFEPADGRFAGYRGVGVRSLEADQELIGEARLPLDDDALRELVHELRTPLNAIIGFAEIIDGQYLGPAESSYRQRALEIVAQARLLLSAIEDLDIAAQLRSSPFAAEGSADLNEGLTAVLPDLKERAARRGVVFDLVPSRTPSQCSLDQMVLERLVRRFCAALIDAAAGREKLSIVATCDIGQCLLTASRPAALRGLSEQQLFGRAEEEPDILATGFSLKLARGIAQTAGGDLRLNGGDKIALVLPRPRA